MLFSLQDKVALVTGATGSIGGAIARFLHKQGAILALSGTRVSSLEHLSEELSERVNLFACNLAADNAASDLISNVERICGKVDILVNNAGIVQDDLLMKMTDDSWNSVMRIDLEAPFRLMRSAIRGMIRRRYGRVINISSIVGVFGNSGQANYAAAKAGLIGLSKTAALELAKRNITVNCVAPGLIASPMIEKISAEYRQKMEESIPMGRIGNPEEVAAAVGFLASSEASYITGHVLHVNGGLAMA